MFWHRIYVIDEGFADKMEVLQLWGLVVLEQQDKGVNIIIFE